MEHFENAIALSSHFGHWPSFHDAELRAMRFADDPAGDFLEIELDLIELSDRVDTDGLFVPSAIARATLSFARPASLQVSDLGPQNVIDELHVRAPSAADLAHLGRPDWLRRLFVEFEPIGGFASVRFFCDGAAVKSAVALRAMRAAS